MFLLPAGIQLTCFVCCCFSVLSFYSKDKSPFHLIPSFRRSNSHCPNLHFTADCNSIFPLPVLFFCADSLFSMRVAVFRARQGCNPPWRLLTGMSRAIALRVGFLGSFKQIMLCETRSLVTQKVVVVACGASHKPSFKSTLGEFSRSF